MQKPSTSYKFNTFQEIKSHSSILYNERMAILFYLLDMKSIKMNTDYSVQMILEVRALLKQIYKNIRTLIRHNPVMRHIMNLETKDKGIYITDIMLSTIDRMIQYCETVEYTTKRVYILVQELNNFEVELKDILQYYSYFIRPDFKQKPDVQIATERYQEMVDDYTVDELKKFVGKKHHIDFDNLKASKVSLPSNVDEEDDEEEDEDD